MRYVAVRLLLLFFVAAPSGGQSEAWHRYTNTKGNFSVLLPVDPQESASGEGEKASHTIQAISGSAGYTVVYVRNEAEQPVDEATYKIYRDNFIKGLPQCNLVREDPVSLSLTGYIGSWYRMNCDVQGNKLTFTGNLYWGRHYAYAALAMFPTGSGDPQTAEKFYNSFSVLDGSK
jgi:hypothetical protein